MSVPSPFSDQPAHEAYRSPEHAAAVRAYQRPGWLTAICVICMVLGVLGGFGALAGGVGLIFNSAIRELVLKNQPKQPGAPPQMAELQEASFAAADKYFWFAVVLLPIKAVVAGALFVSGLMGFTLVPRNRVLLATACLAAAILTPISVAYVILPQIDMLGMVEKIAAKADPAAPAVAPGMQLDTYMAIMRGSVIGGMVFEVMKSLFLAAFYASSVYYLSRSPIVALYGQPAPG